MCSESTLTPNLVWSGDVMAIDPIGDVTRLLGEAASGNERAKNELFECVYEELREMAERHMKQERPGHTLEATGLVHEVYLRLNGQALQKNRPYFFAAAANAMYRILVERARQSQKHHGDRIPLDGVLDELEIAHRVKMLDLHEYLEKLKKYGERGKRQHEVVVQRFFGGLQWKEICGQPVCFRRDRRKRLAGRPGMALRTAEAGDRAMMAATRWNQIMDMFAVAADRGPDQQKAYLDEACADDPDLRARVEELLTNHAMAETEEFLKEPPWVIDELPVRLRDFDHYKQIEYVGHGGMGVVYKAFDESLDCQVALKMSLPRRLTTADDSNRFRIDPRSMAKLRHPNIVQVHKVGECDGKPYFTMNLIQRKDGSVSLAEQPARFRDDPAAAAKLMIQVARAVHHAHQRGILHRDLKPANILLDDEDKPHITDFGLAKQIGKDAKLTESGEPLDSASVAYGGIVGTVRYMSPEQADADPDREVTTVSDVYGLGATLYTLLTGRPPLQADTLEDTLQLVRDPQQKPKPPRELNRRVDRTLEAICLKCLDKDPSRRYRSAEGLARDLERWLRRERTVAPQSLQTRSWNWCRRNPGVATLAVAALALLVTVFVVAVPVAKEREDYWRNTVLRSNTHHARSISGAVLWQLERWSSEVIEVTKKQELRDLLRQVAEDRELRKRIEQTKDDLQLRERLRHDERVRGLQTILDNVAKEHDYPEDDSVGPGNELPLENWYVLSTDGRELADSRFQIEVLFEDFSGRDHFTVPMKYGRERRRGRDSIHIALIYKAVSEPLFKLAICAPVYAGDEPDAPVVGVVATTVTTSAKLGFRRLYDDQRPVALVAKGDMNPRHEGAEPDHDFEYVILIHPAYEEAPGIEPIEFPDGYLPDVRQEGVELRWPFKAQEQVFLADHDYRDPIADLDPEYAGRWLAGFAPVGNTHLCVVVQQKYDEAVAPFTDLAWNFMLWLGLGISLLLLLAGAGVWISFQRKTQRQVT